MKLVLGLLVILTSAICSAATFSYQCYSIDDNEPYGLEKLVMHVEDDSTVKVELDVLKDVVETYKLNPNYVGKTPSMKNYLKFNVINPDRHAYSEGPVSPFYVESELLKGGYPLRRGGSGGFVKTSGHGYSWAKYLCVLQ